MTIYHFHRIAELQVETLKYKVKSQAETIAALENQIAQLTLKNETSEKNVATLTKVIKSVEPRIAELEMLVGSSNKVKQNNHIQFSKSV